MFLVARGVRRVSAGSTVTRVPSLCTRSQRAHSTRPPRKTESRMTGGLVDGFDLLRLMKDNQHIPQFKSIFQGFPQSRIHDAELDEYDYLSLQPTIERDSFWYIEPLQQVNASEEPAVYFLSCLAFDKSCFEGRLRFVAEFDHAPSQKELLDCIKHSFLRPTNGLPKALPELLVLSDEWETHLPGIQPFLDSLPSPFHWQVSPPEHVKILRCVQLPLQLSRAREYFEDAEVEGVKPEGRAGAIELLEKALECLERVECVMDRISVPEDLWVELHGMLADVHYVPASLHMETLKSDPAAAEAALQHGRKLEEYEPSSVHAYTTQCFAYNGLGKYLEAYATLQRALAQPNLQDDSTITALILIMERFLK
ncbi:hypothetical protein Hypma_000461 [Hypsizygus marmoreus]|uniref:Uncharacterized protein n=1 Tax=Hypsizygus marmoreus TaxID=39966 RepID=A0A369J9X2_HYPMA|nr:hypothetical protein Hypma_000461 [Hypsizygus marmoreus]